MKFWMKLFYKYLSEDKDVVIIQNSVGGKYCSCVMYPNGRVMEYVLLDGDDLGLLKDFSLVELGN